MGRPRATLTDHRREPLGMAAVGRQAVQLGTAGELPTQLVSVLELIGDVLVVIVPPER